MVKEIQTKNKALYECEECKTKYKEDTWANKCEKWCRETKSCNLEIIKYASSLEEK